jgi:peroxin-3
MGCSIRRRFEQNQQDCTLTVLSLLPSIADRLFSEMDVERLTEQLKAARTAHLRKSPTALSAEQQSDDGKQQSTNTPIMTDEERQHKLEMWDRLKVMSRLIIKRRWYTRRLFILPWVH